MDEVVVYAKHEALCLYSEVRQVSNGVLGIIFLRGADDMASSSTMIDDGL
jgi:hypothetical protein